MTHAAANSRRQQRAAILITVADGAAAALLLSVALSTGSLSIFAEVVRAAVLMSLQVYTVCVLIHANRGPSDGLEFGSGKIEQTVWAILGIGLLVGAFWVTERIVEVVLGLREAAQPIGLTAAALANAVALLVSYIGYVAVRRNFTAGGSLAFEAYVLVRQTVLYAALFVQVALTLAALTRDPALALAADAIGAAFVVLLKLRRGIRALCRALPDLFDAPAPLDHQRQIRIAAEAALPPDEPIRLRTRRSGRTVEAEITVAGVGCRSTAELAT